MSRMRPLLPKRHVGILAIDPSLTGTGWAVTLQSGGVRTGTISTEGYTGFDRILRVKSVIDHLLDTYTPALVVYEGYSMGRFVGKIFDRAELGGVLKLSIWRRNIPLLVVPPTSLKKFITGKGNADKKKVAKSLAQACGKTFRTSDEADAYGLLMMGTAYSDPSVVSGDRRNYAHAALAGCELIDPT